MKLWLINHDYRYASEQVMLTMFPSERPEYPETAPEGDGVVIKITRGKKLACASCTLTFDGKRYLGRASIPESEITDKLLEDRLLQRIIKLSFYRAAVRCKGTKPVWGALTGIRPGKMMSAYLEKGMSEKAAVSRFIREYDASNERALLCLDTAKASLEANASLDPNDICLYVGIPFCPTRCAYCSFVSQSVEKSMKLIPDFLDALYTEIEATAQTVKKLGLRTVSLYMGGGTPTTLNATQLDSLCAKLYECFDLSALREFTVEAGRPDTITAEKLSVLRAHGVDRISVNPQTMEDHVLEAIGRKHTAEDVIKALELVRAEGGFAVNMDLIAGLPGDTPEGFRRTLQKVLELSPENITVHTLSLKNGSKITLDETPLPPAEHVGEMLDFAGEALRKNGYAPYYLYRQKFMNGGFENVGWCKNGYANLYNICIMEELRSIIAMGGGASTKLVSDNGRIERVFAPKYPKEYIGGIEKVAADKCKIEEFYNGL